MFKPVYCVLVVLVFLAFCGCQSIIKHRLAGTYYRYNPGSTATLAVQKLHLTETKFIMTVPLNGDMAMDYSVENGIIYVGGQPSQICFTVDGMGVISNKGAVGIEGTYIKQVDEN
ncbi:hypothetical protein [Hymenobacter arizonensis]|uniref:Uncharacterized protein n=1 Tax=Hymenobacter arizonensis TaxID=1227077 RepID=A0A1I5YZZ4_HYMAR|nr:hypothetical protein [Hymenobacter arizonensis]SFQ49427.1 hypothetical protein SAMN04515668_2553 [Hymenobacter arizonensis]